MQPFIIGLSGRKGAGKDHTCRILHQCGWEDACHVERIAFADALKDEVAEACGVDRQFIEEHKENFRLILQGWGLQFRRQLHGDRYWLDRADEALARAVSPIVCVTDVRFENEAGWVKSRGGIMVRVVNPGAENSTDLHSSETAMDAYQFDHHLHNSMGPDYADAVRGFWKSVVLPRVNEFATVAQ